MSSDGGAAVGAGPAVTGDAYQVGLLVGAGAAPAVGCWPQPPLAQDQADVVAGWAAGAVGAGTGTGEVYQVGLLVGEITTATASASGASRLVP